MFFYEPKNALARGGSLVRQHFSANAGVIPASLASINSGAALAARKINSRVAPVRRKPSAGGARAFGQVAMSVGIASPKAWASGNAEACQSCRLEGR